MTKAITRNDLMAKLAILNPGIKVLGVVKGTRFPVLVKHNDCGKIFFRTPEVLYKTLTCPYCRKERQKKTRLATERPKFEKWFADNRKNFILISTYTGGNNPITVKHKKCKTEYTSTPNRIKNVNGCAKCNKSKGESLIEDILILNNINYKTQYKFKKLGRLRFDFAVFDKSKKLLFLIEFDGPQHYKPCGMFGGEKAFERLRYNDGRKNLFCADRGITLYRIIHGENVLKKMNKILKLA